MQKELIDGFGEFEIYDHFFVGRIFQGINADSAFVEAFQQMKARYFADRPVIYISDRVNSYSLDPLATIELIKNNNIRSVGIVTYSDWQKKCVPIEMKIFEGIDTHLFNSLAEAISWANEKSAGFR